MLNKLFWVFFEKGGITFLQFITLIILGRLLTPDDYGVYGIMMIFIAVSDMLVDSGFGGALVYKKDISQLDINTLFYVNVAISIVLYLMLFIFSPYIEDYYDVEGLSLYFRVLGLTVILFALSQVQNALIIRNLEFRKSAIIYVSAAVLSSAIAIYMAYIDLGVWSLIAQVFSNSLLITLFFWTTSSNRLSFSFSKESFKYFWSFGSNLVCANILQTIVNNISTSIIPKIGNITQSGHFLQASKINSIPINILILSVDKFCFPVLSKEKEPLCFKDKARSMNRLFFLFFIPIFPILSYCSHPLIHVILGPKWDPVSIYFSLLCWSGIGLLIQGLYRNIIKSLGKTRYIMYVEIVKSLLTIVSLLICASFGIKILILSIVIMSFIGAFIWAFCLRRQLGYFYKEQIRDIIKPIVSVLFIYVSLQVIPISSDCYYRLLFIPLAYFLYLGVNLVLKQEDLIVLFNKYILKIRQI